MRKDCCLFSEAFDPLGLTSLELEERLGHVKQRCYFNQSAVQPNESINCGSYCCYWVIVAAAAVQWQSAPFLPLDLREVLQLGHKVPGSTKLVLHDRPPEERGHRPTLCCFRRILRRRRWRPRVSCSKILAWHAKQVALSLAEPSWNDELGDPVTSTHSKPFHMDEAVLRITMPFRMMVGK
jgi:hypothetical protein